MIASANELESRQPRETAIGREDDVRLERLAGRNHERVRKPYRRAKCPERGGHDRDLLVERHDREADTCVEND